MMNQDWNAVSPTTPAPAAFAASVTASPPGLTPVVQTVDLAKQYGSGAAVVWALAGVSVAFYRGQFTAIMGPSGSGKSTLMHCAAGLDTPTHGQVFLAGTELNRLNDRDLTLVRRQQVGFIFQSFNLIPTMTAQANMLLPLKLAKQQVDVAWFDHVVRVLGLGDRLEHRPSELSGGQQQRVAAARALMTRPQVIFADEPTGALDTASGTELLQFLRRCVDEFNQTIVMVTHDQNAAGYADRIVELRDGRVVADRTNPKSMTAPR